MAEHDTGADIDTDAPPARGGLSSSQLDTGLTVALYVLAVALTALAVLFVYTYVTDRARERGATPAGRAILELEGRVRANPNDAPLRVRYGEALVSAGLLDKGAEQFLNALKLNPEHTGAMLDLGIVAMQKKEYSTAEGYFKKVVESSGGGEFQNIDERRELALFYLGEMALTQKQYEDAISYFKGALRIRRDASDTYLELAIAYQGMGDMTSAKEQLNIALAFDPNLPQANYLLGKILLDEGDEVGAAEHFGTAYLKAPENQDVAEAVEKLGPVEKRVGQSQAALADGNIDEALTEAKIAFGLDPYSFPATVALGKAYEADGNKVRALEAFKKADQIAPGNAEVAEAIKRLSAK